MANTTAIDIQEVPLLHQYKIGNVLILLWHDVNIAGNRVEST